ncbi:MAG: hypothetical protein ACXVI6_02315, partial [Candidatus Aminicenantales bacterium]
MRILARAVREAPARKLPLSVFLLVPLAVLLAGAGEDKSYRPGGVTILSTDTAAQLVEKAAR